MNVALQLQKAVQRQNVELSNVRVLKKQLAESSAHTLDCFGGKIEDHLLNIPLPTTFSVLIKCAVIG